MLVYVISSPNLPNTVYVGSTEKTWKVRWSTHTTPWNGCMSKGIIAAGGASMVVVETVTDPSVNLGDREFFYIWSTVRFSTATSTSSSSISTNPRP
jgi:hypothetical protein